MAARKFLFDLEGASFGRTEEMMSDLGKNGGLYCALCRAFAFERRAAVGASGRGTVQSQGGIGARCGHRFFNQSNL